MPFTDTPDPIIANLTDLGREMFARATMGELKFIAYGFDVGRGGYSESNPVKITPVLNNSTELEDSIFPEDGSKKPVELIEKFHPTTLIANCRLAREDVESGLGEIGLWAKVTERSNTADPVVPAVDGLFLLALGHFPIIVKTQRSVVLFRILVQF